MRNNVLLISRNKEMFEGIRQFIDDKLLKLYNSDPSEIMQKVFLLNPFYLVVDLDEMTHQTIQVIQSVQDLDYIPVMYVGHKRVVERYRRNMPNELLIDLAEAEKTIGILLSQGMVFKKEYNRVSEAYETIDTLTTETKNVMDKYLLRDYGDFSFSSKEVVNNIFSDNPILENKPEYVWVVHSEHTSLISLFVRNEDDVYEARYEGHLDDNDGFGFDAYAENGFKVNCEIERFSDIDANSQMFPDKMRRQLPYLKNFAGYGMDQIIVIGCNYVDEVTAYDSSVLKSMTVTLDLLENIRFQIHEVEGAFNYTLDALARAAEASDDLTGQHIRRVNEYSKLIAAKLGMDAQFIKQIHNSAQMHDVGKIYVDKNILRKKGRLTDFEFNEIRLHPVYGERIIGQSKYMAMAAEIALNHHEKMNGKGYPNGRKGEEIPISARIVMLADIYDALRSERSYKAGFSHEQAMDIIIRGDDRVQPEDFDPEVWRTFKNHHDDFSKIFNELKG